MPEKVDKALRFVSEQMLHRMVAWKLILFVTGAIGTSIIGALAGTKWAAADGQTRLLIIVSIIVNASMTVGAFIDKSLARAARGEDPLVAAESTPPIPPK